MGQSGDGEKEHMGDPGNLNGGNTALTVGLLSVVAGIRKCILLYSLVNIWWWVQWRKRVEGYAEEPDSLGVKEPDLWSDTLSYQVVKQLVIKLLVMPL